jgi:hypothetical protein
MIFSLKLGHSRELEFYKMESCMRHRFYSSMVMAWQPYIVEWLMEDLLPTVIQPGFTTINNCSMSILWNTKRAYQAANSSRARWASTESLMALEKCGNKMEGFLRESIIKDREIMAKSIFWDRKPNIGFTESFTAKVKIIRMNFFTRLIKLYEILRFSNFAYLTPL